tara:strand:+ start:267 stop:542 length:276 start_codon:yes stop_codon:yes gene_type:complete
MKEGDIVRFAKWEEIDTLNSKSWPSAPKNHIGMLVKHDKLMGTAHVIYKGELLRIRSVFVEKAGKKDLQKNDPEFCEACECTPCDCGFGSY